MCAGAGSLARILLNYTRAMQKLTFDDGEMVGAWCAGKCLGARQPRRARSARTQTPPPPLDNANDEWRMHFCLHGKCSRRNVFCILDAGVGAVLRSSWQFARQLLHQMAEIISLTCVDKLFSVERKMLERAARRDKPEFLTCYSHKQQCAPPFFYKL